MDEEPQPDLNCVPYSRTLLYVLLTVPLLCMIGFAAYVLWTYNFIFTTIYIVIFVLIHIVQSYCCYYQSCPYVGGFCPAVAGIVFSSLLAKLLEKLKPKKSKIWFEVLATIGAVLLLGLIVFPLYWLFIYNIIAFIGFLLIVIVYATAFLLTICPVCATRKTCPGGIASTKLRNRKSDT